MAQLREALSRVGFAGVRTYIQTGNILLNSDLPDLQLEAVVHTLIREQIGPDLVVITRTPEQVKQVLDENPFPDLDPSRIFYAFFAITPDDNKIQALTALDFSPEKLHVSDLAAYMYIPGSAARSRLSNNFLEKQLKVGATSRNRNTLEKLLELAG